MRGKTAIAYIRQYKQPKAKIGKIVTYAGHPYRIASTQGDGLILRSQLLVHPNDEYMDYDPPLSTVISSNAREIVRLKVMLYEMTSRGDWSRAGYNPEQYDQLVKWIEGDGFEDEPKLTLDMGDADGSES
jgi:hypothetical protein